MKFLITSALPYANGPLHFGHLAGAYLPADIYTRHRKLQGHQVMHISGSDEHGVAIMLNASKAKQSYQEYVNYWHHKHKQLFTEYGVEFEFFGQTSAAYHAQEAKHWFEVLNKKGAIEPKGEQQLQCQDCHNYLPDRFVEGTCYSCGYEQARGDECPNCALWIEPTKLINPRCKICGSKNIEQKEVIQYYLLLSKYHEQFRNWFDQKKNLWRKSVTTFVESLTEENLHDRAITRDLDWGIDVPLPNTQGKKLYVWFDAPIGYVSNTAEYLRQSASKDDYLKDWWHNSQTQIVHFIGKDNIIFHTIIFPVMGMASDIILPPADVPANQYLNLEGKQFSKSTGWYVDAEEALNDFGQDAMRYYLTTLIPETADSSFSWDQFSARVNNELANNIGNLVSRCLKFIQKNWPEGLSGEFFKDFLEQTYAKKLAVDVAEVHQVLDGVLIKKALEKIMSIGQDANTYFSDQAPWQQFKQDPNTAAKTLAHTAVYIAQLGVLFTPYLPSLAGKILEHYNWSKDLTQKAYSGGPSVIVEHLIKNGLHLKLEIANLVPKIDSKVIEVKKAQLVELAQSQK